MDFLELFKANWQLDDKCMDYLQSMPGEVQAAVIRQFDHKPDQTNPSARCMAFAKKLLQAHVAGEAAAQSEATSATPGFAPPASLGLDSQCLEILGALPQHLQRGVMSHFCASQGQAAQAVPTGLPRGHFPDPAAVQQLRRSMPSLQLLSGLHRPPQRQPPQAHRQAWAQLRAPEEEACLAQALPPGLQSLHVGDSDQVRALLEFQARWGLDDKCMDYLGSMPIEIQMKVSSGFDHRPDQTNPSARCMAFAKKLWQSQDVIESVSNSMPAFQAKWGIDDQCRAFLATLPAQVQAIVVRNFNHNAEQTNVSARCQAFAKSVLQRQSQSGLVVHTQSQPQLQSQTYPLVQPPTQTLIQPPAHRLQSQPAPKLQSQLAQKLQFQPAPKLQFQPAPKLQPGPAHRLQQLSGADGPNGWHPDLADRPDWSDEAGGGAWGKRPRGPNPGPVVPAPDPLELLQFQANWGLDDRCMDYLQSMPAHVQHVVVKKFEHTPDQTNPSKRCMAFARSVLQRTTQLEPGAPLSKFPRMA